MAENWRRVFNNIAPKGNAKFYEATAPIVEDVLRAYGCATTKCAAHLLGQMAHESQGFTRFEENLNYSAKRLTEVWPSRFPSLNAAAPFAKNPKALANKVYNGRMGNRTHSDDGWNFRGSGPLQHTGRSEYGRVKQRTGLDVVTFPERLRDPAAAVAMFAAAASYFKDRGAIAAAERDSVPQVTKLVNGGQIGLKDRAIYTERAKNALFLGEITWDVTDPTIQVDHRLTIERTTDEKRRTAEAAAKSSIPVAVATGATTATATQTDPVAEVTGDVPAWASIAIAGGFVLLGVIVFVVMCRRVKKFEPVPNFVKLDEAGVLGGSDG